MARESRFIKVRDRHINKFNRLMGNKNREINAETLASNNQLQAPNNSKKWVVNLSSTPLPSPKGSCYQKDQIMQ